MLTHPTLDQLRALKLDGMADAFAELQTRDGVDDLPHADWLALLIDRELADRNTRRFRTRLRAAALRHVGAAIEDVDHRTARKLDRGLFQHLATGRWIEERRNLLITGHAVLSTLLEVHDFLVLIACSRPPCMRVRGVKRHDLALRDRPGRSLADLFRLDGAGADQP